MKFADVIRPGLAFAVVALAASGCSHTPGDRLPSVEASIASDAKAGAPAAQDPAVLPNVLAGDTVAVKLVLLDRMIEIAPGVKYQTWTFNGSVPGPVIHARVGQTIDVTLTNKSGMAHSIDFHSALAPPNVAYQSIAPGMSIHFSWVAKYPGAFLYHCGTPPVLMHISNACMAR